MRLLLTGSTDNYGHSALFWFPRCRTAADNTGNNDNFHDRSFFHSQLRPCLNILMTNSQSAGIAVVVDFREVSSIDQMNAIISSLIISQNEVCPELKICYCIEPSSRQLRRALCRFVKCGKDVGDDSTKLQSSVLKIPFQVLLFANHKSLKDHFTSDMLPEDLGGSLMFDEVTYLLQISVIDTFGKLKASIAAMHSFIEGASSGDILDGDVSVCLEHFLQIRQQAFGLFSHLKNTGFNRFNPFPIFRKLFAEGDAVHSLAMEIRELLLDKQSRLNAFSKLCTKLGEGENILNHLGDVLKSADNVSDLQTMDTQNSTVFRFFEPSSGPLSMASFIADMRYLTETAIEITKTYDELSKQLFATFDFNKITQTTDDVEARYSVFSEKMAVLADERDRNNEKHVSEAYELTGTSSNSPCPMSSSSMSHDNSDGSANMKTSLTTPSLFEVSPVADVQQSQINEQVEKTVVKGLALDVLSVPLPKLNLTVNFKSPNAVYLANLAQLCARFEARADFLCNANKKSAAPTGYRTVNEIKFIADKLGHSAKKMLEHSNQPTCLNI